MGIIFIDGAEDNYFDPGRWPISTGMVVESSSGLSMSGSYVIAGTANNDCMRKTFSSSYSELYISFLYRMPSQNASYPHCIIAFRDSAGTIVAAVDRNYTSSKVELRLGACNGSLLATGTKLLNLNTTYLIKVRYKPLNSGGEFSVWVDDYATADATYSGDTTSGNENVQSISFGNDSTYGWGYFYVDDVVVSTTDLTQVLRVAGLAVTGAGTTTQWDPSTGSNYANVDELGTPDDTNYNSTNTTDEVDTFALADNAEDIGSIAAVQVSIRCAYQGTTTPKHLQAVVRTHSTDYASGTDIHPPTSFNSYTQIWTTNPNTASAWDETEIDALEVGYKATT